MEKSECNAMVSSIFVFSAHLKRDTLGMTAIFGPSPTSPVCALLNYAA